MPDGLAEQLACQPANLDPAASRMMQLHQAARTRVSVDEGGTVMGTFDKQRFVSYLRDNVSPAAFGEGRCALHVRLALAAGGLVPASHPVSAKDWGPTLETLGFTRIQIDPEGAQLGDIAVIQSTSASADGHIEAYDGSAWI
jgi:hypothetical protein